MYGLAIGDMVMPRRLGPVAQGSVPQVCEVQSGEGWGRLLFSSGLCSACARGCICTQRSGCELCPASHGYIFVYRHNKQKRNA